MKTCAPSATKRRAVARPMPLLPPVMTATLPSSFPIMCSLRPFERASVPYNTDVSGKTEDSQFLATVREQTSNFMKRAAAAQRLGRPRSFNTEDALDAAMQVFWSKGYEGASLADLTAAMGINRPSLYAAFGDKEALFRKVLDRYNSGPAAYVCDALNQPTARRAIERLL